MRWEPTHGTRAYYRRGCRCEPCRAAERAYNRAYAKGVRTGWPRVPKAERFWTKVQKGEGCWEWTGSKSRFGYGQFGNPDGKPTMAHREAWQFAYGPIPAGQCVLHRCDNPPCVRPSHLFLGTRGDNNRDAARKGRHVGSRRLTPEQVIAIRELYAAGELQDVIAAAYKISQSAVSAIVLGKRWPHVLPTMQEEAARRMDAVLRGTG